LEHRLAKGENTFWRQKIKPETQAQPMDWHSPQISHI